VKPTIEAFEKKNGPFFSKPFDRVKLRITNVGLYQAWSRPLGDPRSNGRTFSRFRYFRRLKIKGPQYAPHTF